MHKTPFATIAAAAGCCAGAEHTVAHKFTGALAEPARFKAEGAGSMKPAGKPAQDTEVRVRKPSGHSGH